MTDKDKLEKVVKLADAMYHAAQYMTTDASRLHRAMDEYHQFIITEYNSQEPASEDLEQASEEYAYTNWESDDYHEGASEGKPFDAIGHTRKCFIDGAQWQKTQDQQTIELAEEHAMFAGMMQEREKMMKDAIEGEIIGCPDGALGSAIRFQCYALREVAHFPITAEIGKKVKIIIIKE